MLAPYKVAAGVTAKVDLVFVVDRGDQPAQRVRLAGRLLLTRTADDGRWAVFGYDLHRSATPRSASLRAVPCAAASGSWRWVLAARRRW